MQVRVQGIQALAAASVLRKLCLFNCKLAEEEAHALQQCLRNQGFGNLEDLDLAGNMIEAPQMQGILTALQQQDIAPKLKVTDCYDATHVH